MNVITGYFATFTIFNVTFLGQGHVKVKQILKNVYTVMYHRHAKYEKDKQWLLKCCRKG